MNHSMSKLNLNTAYSHHALVGLFIGIWLVVLLIFIGPFDIVELPLVARFQILPIYGIIAFLCYNVLIPFQNWWFMRSGQWNLLLEVVFFLIFNFLVLAINFIYYRSSIINGDSDLITFSIKIYLPIFIVLLPVLLFSRWYLSKRAPEAVSEKIVLRGENKRDILKLLPSEILFVSSAENYVEISYLSGDVVKKKLLRSTLKDFHAQVPSLARAHRSFLINPNHIKEWKNASTIVIYEMDIPVSKKYRAELLQLA